MEDTYLPLPTADEVLVCTPSTTAEEVTVYMHTAHCTDYVLIFQVELFWMRAVSDPGFKRLFSLVHAEKLTYQVSDQALHSLSLCKGKQGMDCMQIEC